MAAPASADGHEEINLDTIENLTIKDGELYWRGSRLKTETVQHVALTGLQGLGGVLIVVGALASPIVAYVANLDKICAVTGSRAPFCHAASLEKRKSAEEPVKAPPGEKAHGQ
jgi:hypothetical protein